MNGTHTYANITWFKTDNDTITFIGFNTSSFYDEQLVAIAYEIYHLLNEFTGLAVDESVDDELVADCARIYADEQINCTPPRLKI